MDRWLDKWALCFATYVTIWLEGYKKEWITVVTDQLATRILADPVATSVLKSSSIYSKLPLFIVFNTSRRLSQTLPQSWFEGVLQDEWWVLASDFIGRTLLFFLQVEITPYFTSEHEAWGSAAYHFVWKNENVFSGLGERKHRIIGDESCREKAEQVGWVMPALSIIADSLPVIVVLAQVSLCCLSACLLLCLVF